MYDCRWLGCVLVWLQMLVVASPVQAQTRDIPDPLRPWQDWVTWDVPHRNCPAVYSDAQTRICFWPSELSLSARQDGGKWTLNVDVFEQTLVPLPGNAEVWPVGVRAGGETVPVVESADRRPAVSLPPGKYEVSGEFRWDEMPQRISLSPQIGILSLTVDDRLIATPNWDERGDVWLKRKVAADTDQNLLSARVYRVLDDGIPMWLRTEVELTVSGKSREEIIGQALPAGWKLSSVDSKIPVAIDDDGQMKAQVRAGRFIVQLQAFRTTPTNEVRYAADVRPVTSTELIGFRSNPTLRVAEIEGLAAVDVSQTTYPERWRDLPVYQWPTDTAFRIKEKMRGMGLQRPAGLTIDRQLWLDEDGRGITYRDQIRGQMQQVWRLDAAEGYELGVVRVDGEAQLITANPTTEAWGVEVRQRNLNLEAVGRLQRGATMQATGWQANADSASMTFALPPGWRMLALWGADRVVGDWLTAWTQLDLFLLLVFALAVFRMWGLWAGITAFLGFGLAYHELGAPRFTWLLLLMPLALLRVVHAGTARRWIQTWKLLALVLLAIWLIPFVARQVQSTIYPQLEEQGTPYAPRRYFGLQRLGIAPREAARRGVVDRSGVPRMQGQGQQSGRANYYSREAGTGKAIQQQTSNLLYDPKAKIQTGPAEPTWSWNQVVCAWKGPVTADQRVRPILIPPSVHRALNAIRVVLLLALLAVLLSDRRARTAIAKPAWGAGVLLLTMLWPQTSYAQFPDPVMLDTLRTRLLEPATDAFPHAADIPFVELTVMEDKLVMKAEVHAVVPVAVPLPGKLPDWSPLRVLLDDQPSAVLCRKDGYLWLNTPAGVHQVVIEGRLSNAPQWEWTFLLKPRRVRVDAQGWNVTGIGANGVPEQQIFLARQLEKSSEEAAYDRKDFNSILALDRRLEIGLRWKLENTVTRLAASAKAVSIRVPLLEGESVLTPNVVVENGFVEVRLGIGEQGVSWSSELPVGEHVHLAAASTDAWVERWHLVTSPVWNATLSGLAPIFEAQQSDLVPVWYPWPGEEVDLAFARPEAISGQTMTIQNVQHDVSVGDREHTTQLTLDVNCSLGDDFRIDLDPAAEISSLTRDGQSIPVRRDDGGLIVPLHPGNQKIHVAWRALQPLRMTVKAGQIKLPAEAANAQTSVSMPDNRWVLWAQGPLRGPAVRFWTILVCAVLAAAVLGSFSGSPLRRLEWVLLAIGLTQVHVVAALIVVAWFFVLAWRGRQNPEDLWAWRFDLQQIFLVIFTFIVLGIFVRIVAEGLLGDPRMFILGNGSTATNLRWFQPRSGTLLPEPKVISISVSFYRLLMLLWALWLANAVLRWLKWAWAQFTHISGWRRVWKKRTV